MTWTILISETVGSWLDEVDERTYEQAMAALKVLAEEGPSLGRPLVDSIKGSRHKNMKELRPGSSRRTEVRILFAFDPLRAGDKAGNWRGWYRRNIPEADKLFDDHVRGLQR